MNPKLALAFFGSQDTMKDKRLSHLFSKSSGSFAISRCPGSSFPVLSVLVAEGLESTESWDSELCHSNNSDEL
jgi:hypothetical protein